jgi:hypothetical protein
MNWQQVAEGARIFGWSWRNRLFPRRYKGKAEVICRQIVKDCWNGHFFQTSTGNFSQFWTRDFGWCIQSLMKLGYEKEVHHTLRYALNRFSKYKGIKCAITPAGRPFDFPKEAVDSLPWLIHSIRIGKFPYHSYKNFLNSEIKRFFASVVHENGLVKKEQHFSSMKDHAVRQSSCYDNCMLGMLAKDLRDLKLENPCSDFDYPDLIKKYFWNGSYFFDDLSRKAYVAGDANLFPFILGLINDREMLQSALQQIRQAGLDNPFPLKYTVDGKDIKLIWQDVFVKDYETNAIWMHMGPLYVKMVASVEPKLANVYLEKYQDLIEQAGNYMEVYTVEGKPYSSPFYYSDSGMLWAANYLTLI